ncbi:MAG: DUF4965 domain-containing protein [Oscillospiraceae bacterium]|nr:DUF4965 domain-containing protein [Oscillospiraceae bacterium]
MKLRAPSVPLITVDPYFSIWSNSDKLTGSETTHWTEYEQPLTGVVFVDSEQFLFMGKKDGVAALEQTELEITACTTCYSFKNEKITLKAEFTSPLLTDDLEILSRPTSYLKITTASLDGKEHEIKLQITMDDSVCLNKKFQYPTVFETLSVPGITGARVSAKNQHILNRSGDNLRIDWGYAYLTTNAENAFSESVDYSHEYGIPAHDIRLTVNAGEALFVFAYDDIRSIQYFGENLTSYWNRNKKSIITAIKDAFADYNGLKARCDALAEDLKAKCQNEQYYEILTLAYRQAIAAHKIAVDTNGELLFISKECFSNGCAATVDVTYPSIPLFLLYNPELINAMLRPVFKYADSDEWYYEFAPHDVGQYPLVNGQVSSDKTCPQNQMPVEECGNMLITVTAAALASKETAFAKEHWDDLQKWANFLLKYGLDPKNQLCTDDFTGHLAHNCNLSIKAIMGIAAFGILNNICGNGSEGEKYISSAREMAKAWVINAKDDENVYRLAFDRPGTWSMKYNAVWDKVFGIGIFPENTFDEEIRSNIEKHMNTYGLPLDNRSTYTKSDWLLWTAALANDEKQFDTLVDSLWRAYNESESRVPLTDWYFADTAKQRDFQNRTVQGGLFIKLLIESGKCKAE